MRYKRFTIVLSLLAILNLKLLAASPPNKERRESHPRITIKGMTLIACSVVTCQFLALHLIFLQSKTQTPVYGSRVDSKYQPNHVFNSLSQKSCFAEGCSISLEENSSPKPSWLQIKAGKKSQSYQDLIRSASFPDSKSACSELFQCYQGKHIRPVQGFFENSSSTFESTQSFTSKFGRSQSNQLEQSEQEPDETDNQLLHRIRHPKRCKAFFSHNQQHQTLDAIPLVEDSSEQTYQDDSTDKHRFEEPKNENEAENNFQGFLIALSRFVQDLNNQ